MMMRKRTGIVFKAHRLKIHPEYFQPVLDGIKLFEIRKNDRNFQVGDFATLNEYNPDTKEFTGRTISVRISYMTDFMQHEGYVVLGLKID
ncbi:DUF3850 domain-containing protein [Listeria booriae]|nr:DUF3850 domain-containing protein [Listeria booriae]